MSFLVSKSIFGIDEEEDDFSSLYPHPDNASTATIIENAKRAMGNTSMEGVEVARLLWQIGCLAESGDAFKVRG